MLNNKRQNYHHSKLPNLGDIVIVKCFHMDKQNKWIVESFPLCDNVLPYSIGIYTVNIRNLSNGQTNQVSGHWCEVIS